MTAFYNNRKMKRIILPLFAAFAFLFVFNACSTDVDLYNDYKDITVVYGLLDPGKDINYVKINKAFLGPGNALDIALIADSCNYPNKLDAKIIEFRSPANQNNYQVSKTMVLDTITIHDKEPGIFYAPDQLVYYTAEKIRKNNDQYKYRYKLEIDRGDTILTATTDIVGGDLFMPDSKPLSFSSTTGTVKWFPCPNAAVYEVVIKLYFTEVGPGVDSVQRCMNWSLGTRPVSQLTDDHGKFVMNYTSSVFYATMASFLGSDTIGGATEKDVERIISDYCIGVSISAGGEELYNFISVNAPSSSLVQSIPEYTNVNGGYGVFSSRAAVERRVKLSSIPELTAHENWRFRQG